MKRTNNSKQLLFRRRSRNGRTATRAPGRRSGCRAEKGRRPGRNVPAGASGFSIMEILLATAILLGSVVVVGELLGIGRRHAEAARARATAQLLCRTKLNEILCGLAPLEQVDAEPIEPPDTLSSEESNASSSTSTGDSSTKLLASTDMLGGSVAETSTAAGDSAASLQPNGPVWWYSVELLESAAVGSLVPVRVTVWQAVEADAPARYVYSLVRWVRADTSSVGSETYVQNKTSP